ncbi:MAG: isoprenyl transferase [Oligoflexales bacterium]|nr:isoprenyl transferase [Oligoflexales bacterium]
MISAAEADISIIKAGIIPRHVAIIMDGNGRWAKMRLQPRIFGHRKGVESVRKAVEVAAEIGVKVLTLYAFSEENWGRPQEEVSAIMSLLDTYIVKERENLKKNHIRIKVIGCLDKLSEKSRSLIQEADDFLKDESKMLLNVALSYGSRTEIALACQAIAQKVQDGRLSPMDISPELISEHLFTANLPDPDLMIRTSGEQRVSNFLLWQIAYTELWFTPVLWPDFKKEHFLEGVLSFQKRKRRFGLVEHAQT